MRVIVRQILALQRIEVLAAEDYEEIEQFANPLSTKPRYGRRRVKATKLRNEMHRSLAFAKIPSRSFLDLPLRSEAQNV